MSSLDDLLAAQAGASQAPQGLDALLAQRASGAPAPQVSAPPAQPLSFSDRFMKGLNDVSSAGAQLLTHALPDKAVDAVNSATQYVNNLPGIGPVTQALGIVPGTAQSLDQDIKSGEQDYQARRQTSGGDPGIDWARMGGNALGSVALAGAAPAATGLAGAAAQGAAFGALSQPVTSGDYWKEKGKQAALGAATNTTVSGLAKVLAPKVSPDVQTLLDSGVTPTPGQILGGGANRIEQAATSVPVLGDMIKNAQRRTVDQFNTAAVNRALTPIADKLPDGVAGREALEYASNKLGSAYDAVLSKVGAIKPDEKALTDLANLQDLTTNLPKASSDQFARIVDTEILGRFKDGAITGEGLKAAESNLGALAKGYGRSSDFDQRQLGTAIQEAQATLRNMLARAKPDVAEELSNINTGYANLMRVQRAASYVGSDGGVFTPAQLQSAVKALDPSRNNRQFATGNALMQDLSEAGKNVMGSKVPDSGTPFRSSVQLGLAALLGHGMVPASVSAAAPMAALGAAAATLPYTSGGQKLAAFLLTQRPAGADEAAKFLRSLAPYASAATIPALAQH